MTLGIDITDISVLISLDRQAHVRQGRESEPQSGTHLKRDSGGCVWVGAIPKWDRLDGMGYHHCEPNTQV